MNNHFLKWSTNYVLWRLSPTVRWLAFTHETTGNVGNIGNLCISSTMLPTVIKLSLKIILTEMKNVYYTEKAFDS